MAQGLSHAARQLLPALKRAQLAIGLVLVLMVILLALEGLGGGTTPGGQSGQQGGGGGGGQELPMALDFTLRDIYGHQFSLSDFRGKVVILDFFATYCKPCKTQVEELKEVKRQFGDEVVIISISVSPEDTNEVLRSYAEENGITWRVARDTAGVGDAYNVLYLPTLVVVDPEGRITARHVGLTDSETLAKEVEAALG